MFDVKSFVVVGQKGLFETLITEKDTAMNFGSGRLGNLLATPSLVKFMIAAAVEAVDSHLPEGIVTVGTMMKYEHVAPSIIGATVRVEAEVTQIDGNLIKFQITAADDLGEIGTGEHTRRIVNREELVKRVHDRVDKMARNHP